MRVVSIESSASALDSFSRGLAGRVDPGRRGRIANARRSLLAYRVVGTTVYVRPAIVEGP
jgi:hypothetical protein